MGLLTDHNGSGAVPPGMTPVRVEPASAATEGDTVVRVMLGDRPAPSVAVGAKGIVLDGDLLPVPVTSPGLAKTSLSRKRQELVVRFPARFTAVDHWWGRDTVLADLPAVAAGAVEHAGPEDPMRHDLRDLGLFGDLKYRLRARPAFAPPQRTAAEAATEPSRRDHSLAAVRDIRIGTVIGMEAPLVVPADAELAADVLADPEARSEPAAQLAASILSLKRTRSMLPMRRLALLAAMTPPAQEADDDDDDDGAELYETLTPTWRECTDAVEVAEVARVLSEHAGLVPEEASVFFAFSFLPHACLPNAALVRDEGPEVTLVAVLDVPAGGVLTVDRLHWPRVYAPAWVRAEHLQEMGCACACPLCTGDHPEVVRAFVCPSCTAPELLPRAPSRSSELGPLRCRSCGHDATDDERAACAAAEAAFDEEPTLLTAEGSGGLLSHLHYLNVQLAWNYLFELAPLEEPTLHEQHRAVVEVLVDAVRRLHPTASPRTLRELYQVASELYDTSGGDAAELAAQQRSLRRLAALQEHFFPRTVAGDVQLTRKLLGPEGERVLGET